MLDPAALLKFIEVGGVTGLLAVIVWAFATRKVVPLGEVERQDRIIAEKDVQIRLLQNDNNLLRELVQRGQGSQQVQATLIKQVGEAVIDAMTRLQAKTP